MMDDLSKVSGGVRYACDAALPGMLHAKLLRSPYPHARILGIDATAALALPGVACVVTGEDAARLPDPRHGFSVRDQPVIAIGKVRYVGHSNRAGWQIAEAEYVARELGTARFVSSQSHYNLVDRRAELDVVLDARGQAAGGRAAGFDSGRAVYAGSAAGLTDFLADLLTEADGVRLHPASLFVDLEELARLVLPELRRRGVLRPVVQDGTFRDLLGLPRPASRYTTASAASVGAGK